MSPPAGAAWLIVTVPVELVPPVTVPGLKLTPDTVVKGTTVTFPMTMVAPVVAVTITGVEAATEPPVAVKVCEFMFAGTTTVAGTGNAVELLLRLTVYPPAGAFPLSVTVPVVICPETTFPGVKESIVTTGGFTVSPAGMLLPLGSVAVKFTTVLAATGNDEALNVPLVAPPAMLKLAGAVAALVLLLITVTVKPAAGAGPLRTTVPIEPPPP